MADLCDGEPDSGKETAIYIRFLCIELKSDNFLFCSSKSYCDDSIYHVTNVTYPAPDGL